MLLVNNYSRILLYDDEILSTIIIRRRKKAARYRRVTTYLYVPWYVSYVRMQQNTNPVRKWRPHRISHTPTPTICEQIRTPVRHYFLRPLFLAKSGSAATPRTRDLTPSPRPPWLHYTTVSRTHQVWHNHALYPAMLRVIWKLMVCSLVYCHVFVCSSHLIPYFCPKRLSAPWSLLSFFRAARPRAPPYTLHTPNRQPITTHHSPPPMTLFAQL